LVLIRLLIAKLTSHTETNLEDVMHAVQRILVAGTVMAAIAGTTGTAFAATSQGLRTAAASRPADGPPAGTEGNGLLGALGAVGDLVSALAGGAGTLGFLLPSPNGTGANFVNGLLSNPAGAITGSPNSILPYGLLDGGK